MGTHESRIPFNSPERVVVPRVAVEHVLAFMRTAGQIGCEALGLWVGEQSENRFMVRQAYIPEQRCIRGDRGLLVHVGEGALHQMNVWLFESGYTILAQLHSHPSEAYHSETDDLFPIATKRGTFSIVVPHFARDPFDLRDSAVYRLNEKGWIEITKEEASTIFEIR